MTVGSWSKSGYIGQDLVYENFELQICHENCQMKKSDNLRTYELVLNELFHVRPTLKEKFSL
jgi:hypothetical protein